MFNPVQQLHIGKASGAVNTASVGTLITDMANVVIGDVFMVNSNLKVIAAAADITPKIHFATGIAAGKVKLSPAITVGNIISIATQAYAAQVQKVVAVGNVGSGALDLAPLSGNTYKMTVLIKDDQRFMTHRQTKRDYVIRASFASSVPTTAEKAAFTQQFVDAINKDAFLNTLVIASLNTTATAHGIAVTGKAQTYNNINNRVEYVDFTTSFYDVTDSTSSYQATTTVVTAPVLGTGSGNQIDAIERKLAAYDGFTNKIQFPIIPIPLFASTSTNYDTIAINHFDDTAGILEGRDKKPKAVILALSTGSAQFTAMQASLKLLNDSGANNISNNTSFLDTDI